MVKNEIRNLHHLKPYHISPLIEVFETIDAVVLVQHKADAGDMMNFLKKQSHCYGEELIKGIIFKILEKVAVLHMIGYIHRDLKPANILFRAEGADSPLYLSDLGLTVRKEQLQNKNINHYSCGTLGFVAPEVLEFSETGKVYDQSCDVFSVGCIFYFLHTGNDLFVGRNKKDLYLKNRNCSDLEEKLNRVEHLSHEALDLMRQLLCPDPLKRISAEEACNHLYFRDVTRPDRNEVIFEDTHSLNSSFIANKIHKYWSNFKVEIS